jgi:hypothetical protein
VARITVPTCLNSWGFIMAIDRLFILIAFVWLLCGMLFGIYIGINELPIHSNAHAHAGLLGFVISSLFGLFHRGWPAMGRSRLAMAQLVIYEIGVVVLVAGKYQVSEYGSSPIVAPGAVITVLGTLLMAWLFVAKAND